MASLDVSLYSVGLGIVLIVVYIFPSFHIQRIFGKVSWIFNPWLHDPRDKIKGEAIEAVELSQASENPHQTIEKVSQYSSSWWTDEKIFQLERRGIFSKACAFQVTFQVLSTQKLINGLSLIDMALRHSYVPFP